ncbi:DUF4231 domain-containing protein [Streptomyces capoamus]|uniref:DUF4231 domain-containing protein n=1 Tax=Streptomyces capoamus TaxID=68183 RepID=UPI003C2FF39B
MGESIDLATRRVWDLQSVWSQAADAVKQQLGRARAVGLALGVAAASLSTLGAQVMGWQSALGRALDLIAAVCAGLVPLAVSRSGMPALRDWTRLRSVSEALKSEVFICLARVGGYRGQDAAGRLLDRAGRVVADAGDLAYRTRGLVPKQRPLPDVVDVDSYVAVRLVGQVNGYYRPRAALMSRRCAVVRRCETALAGLAAVLGATASVFGTDGAAVWVATVTTVTATVTAHAAAARYVYQELEFSRTAAELEDMLARREALTAPGDRRDDDDFVERCELVISAQNEAWMARWTAD